MDFNNTFNMLLPDEFPEEEYSCFMTACKSILIPVKTDSWRQFAGASNLIMWRFRSCYEDMKFYIDSWVEHGVNVSRDELYMRERALFGMFSSGVSCIESTCYAIYSLASHASIYNLPFGDNEQRRCSPKNLKIALSSHDTARNIVTELISIINSSEWEFWVDLRNRMSHRSNIPRVIRGAGGSSPPPAKALQFGATSSTPAFEADEDHLVNLYEWLAQSLRNLLVEGGNIANNP